MAPVPLSKQPFPPVRPPLPYLVNSVAIPDDGNRIIAGTFYYQYWGTIEPETRGTYGIYAIDRATGKRIWADEETHCCQGVFAVAVSADGKVAAAGGLLSEQQGLLRAYQADNGSRLLDYGGIRTSLPGNSRNVRVSCVSLSGDGKVLAAVADKIYVFFKNGKTFDSSPVILAFSDAFHENSLPTAVAVHHGGKWLAACDKKGNVCAALLDAGKLGAIYRWRAPLVPINRAQPNGPTGPVEMLSAAVARNTDAFAAGGNDYVYYFRLGDMMQHPEPVAQYDTWDQIAPPPPANGTAPQVPPRNVRWVAMSGDGSLVSTVVNRYRNGGRNGSLLLLKSANGTLERVWEEELPHNPNSTSLDLDGTHVVASDGYPFGTPGAFHGFDVAGNSKWTYQTGNMNWPVVISGDGRWIAGGGDDGLVYTFARM